MLRQSSRLFYRNSTPVVSGASTSALPSASLYSTRLYSSLVQDLASEKKALETEIEQGLANWAKTNLEQYNAEAPKLSLEEKKEKRALLKKSYAAERAKWEKTKRDKNAAAIEKIEKALASAQEKKEINPFLAQILSGERALLQQKLGFDEEQYNFACALTLLENKLKPGDLERFQKKVSTVKPEDMSTKEYIGALSGEVEPFWVESINGLKMVKETVLEHNSSAAIANLNKAYAHLLEESEVQLEASKESMNAALEPLAEIPKGSAAKEE